MITFTLFAGFSFFDRYRNLPADKGIEFWANMELPQKVQLTRTCSESTETPFE